MIDLKTGYLLGLSAELGAIIVGVNQKEIDLLREFGRRIGRAFQIQDDILEIFSNSKTMGKSLESDLILGKKTFLMVDAENKNPGFINEISKLICKDYKTGLIEVRNMLLDIGSYNSGKNLIKVNLDHANNILKDLKYDKQYLQYFTNIIENRKF